MPARLGMVNDGNGMRMMTGGEDQEGGRVVEGRGGGGTVFCLDSHYDFVWVEAVPVGVWLLLVGSINDKEVIKAE